MSTAKGEETRRRIVQAAWDLSSRRGIEQLLCGVSLREVAAEAGLSPSALTYHFPTMRDLALGMTGAFVDSLDPLATDSVAEVFGQLDAASLAKTVREAAAVNWAVLTSDAEVEYQRHLTRCYSVTGDDPDGVEVMGRLAFVNDYWLEQLTTTYEQAAARAGMRLVEPFTMREMAQAIAGMTEGLLHQWMCDPGSVRDDLIVDMAVVFAGVLLTPAGSTVGIEELTSRLPRRADQARSSYDAVASAVGVAGLFVSGVEGVTLTEVAVALGLETADVLERFGSVRRVAALGFARHVGGVEVAAMRRRGADPRLPLSDALFELARCVQGDPWCALALHVERVESRAGVRPGSAPGEIGDLVPLDEVFEALLEPNGGTPIGSSSIDPGDAAELMVDTVLNLATRRPALTIGAVVEAAMRIGEPYFLAASEAG